MNGNAHKYQISMRTIAVAIATAGVLCFPQIMNLKGNELGFTNSIFSVFIWILCIYMLNHSLNNIDIQDARGWKIAGILSFLFTVAMLFGARLDTEGNVNFKDWRLWISMPILTCFFAVLVRGLWRALESIGERKNKDVQHIKAPRFWETIVKHESLAIYLCLIISWIPVLLAVYPGFFVYDAQNEYVQVASRAFSTHHPLVHVLMLGGIICAVHKVTGSYNLGIACYMIVQMLMAAGVFTYLLRFLRKRKVTGRIRFLSVLWFAFFPVVVMYVMCSTKDTIFTAALLLLLVCLLEMCISTESFFHSKLQMTVFVFSVLTMTLFRKNAFYAFIVMTPALLIYFKKNFRKIRNY